MPTVASGVRLEPRNSVPSSGIIGAISTIWDLVNREGQGPSFTLEPHISPLWMPVPVLSPGVRRPHPAPKTAPSWGARVAHRPADVPAIRAPEASTAQQGRPQCLADALCPHHRDQGPVQSVTRPGWSARDCEQVDSTSLNLSHPACKMGTVTEPADGVLWGFEEISCQVLCLQVLKK